MSSASATAERACIAPRERGHPGPPPAFVCGDLNLLRCLVDRGIPLVVIASDPHEPTLRSRHALRSHLIRDASAGKDALADLEELARGWPERPVLYYGTDAMLLLVSRNRERLAK